MTLRAEIEKEIDEVLSSLVLSTKDKKTALLTLFKQKALECIPEKRKVPLGYAEDYHRGFNVCRHFSIANISKEFDK